MVMMLAVRYSKSTAGESLIIPQFEKLCHWQLILLLWTGLRYGLPLQITSCPSKAVYAVKASHNISKTIKGKCRPATGMYVL